MKNIIYTLFFICSVFTASSQVTLTLDEYNGLVKKIDSLEKSNEEILSFNTLLKKDLSNQSDSLNNLIHLLQVENDDLINEKDTLSNELSKQQMEVIFCNKKLEENRVTIESLQNKLNTLNEEYSSYKKQSLLNEQKKYENGKQEVLKTVTESYKSLSFDEMIKASSEGQVKRDLKLVVDTELNEKLKDLEVYFSAKRLLTEKFNDQKIQAALQRVNSMNNKSSLVTLLHENLDNYKLRKEALKEVIKEIQKIDARFIANTNNDQKEKKGLIMAELAWLIYNYDFNNFEDYPYLSSIIIEIMSVKNKDANKDITYILSKL